MHVDGVDAPQAYGTAQEHDWASIMKMTDLTFK